MKTLMIVLFCTLFAVLQLPAQILAPVKATYSLSKVPVKKGDEVTLIFTMNLDKNWHVYSNVQDYQIGPIPACFVFEPHSSYKLLGGVVPKGAKLEYEPVFDVQVNYFEGQAVFQQKVKVLADQLVVKGWYDFQLCNVQDGQCIFSTEDFEFNYLNKKG